MQGSSESQNALIEWNDETHQFEPKPSYKEKVERKGKVKITIGNKEYIV